VECQRQMAALSAVVGFGPQFEVIVASLEDAGPGECHRVGAAASWMDVYRGLKA
jgi:hypothetical protein